MDAAVEGDDAEPWDGYASVLPIPPRFTQEGEGPRVTIETKAGTVQRVVVSEGPARVALIDHDTSDADPPFREVRGESGSIEFAG